MTIADNKTDTINAYVDGELTGAEAAAFLRELAGDGDLARRVAELTMLKSALRESFDDIPCPDSNLQEIFRRHDAACGRDGPIRRWMASLRPRLGGHGAGILLGAGVALMVVILAGAMFFWQAGGSARDGFVADAIQAHRQWLLQPPTADDPAGRRQLAAFQLQNGDIYVPDLSASKLSIGLVTQFDGDGVQVGYVGTRSCHLSLFIRPGDALGPLALNEALVGDVRVFRWRENRLDYALLAVGMDPDRMRLIANDVVQATRLMQPFDGNTQMTLRLNRQQSQPCAA